MLNLKMSIKKIFHPIVLMEELRWKRNKKKLGFCGKNSFMGKGFVIREPQNIIIGNDFIGQEDCQLCTYERFGTQKSEKRPQLVIGNNVTMTKGCFVSCLNRVEIGDGTLLGVNVFITDNFHGNNTREELDIPPNNRLLYSKNATLIGKNVWLGRNVCVMPGVTIGDGAIIGSNAVVTHDIPARCIAAGVPAKIIKEIDK